MSETWAQKNPERAREINRAHYARARETDLSGHRAARRAQMLKDKYGLTPEAHEALSDAQEGCCGICGEEHEPTVTRPALDVDHCHATGDVRGLLCAKCNKGLGSFEDDIERIQRAIDYLKGPR